MRDGIDKKGKTINLLWWIIGSVIIGLMLVGIMEGAHFIGGSRTTAKESVLDMLEN